VLTMLLAMCALVPGALVADAGRPGGPLRGRIQQLRLGKVLGAAAGGRDRGFVVSSDRCDDLARLFMGALMVVGLAQPTASRRRAG